MPRALGRQPLQDDLDVHTELSGDLARPGGAAVALAELGGGVVDQRLQLPQPARHAGSRWSGPGSAAAPHR